MPSAEIYQCEILLLLDRNPCLHPMPAPHACTPCLDRTPPTCPQHTQATGMPLAARPLQAVTSMGPWTLGTSIAHHCQHTTASTPLPAHHCQHITASTSLPLPAHHCHCECITALPAHHCKHTTDTTDTHHSQQQESVIKKRHQEAPSRSAAIKKRRHQEAPSRHQEAPSRSAITSSRSAAIKKAPSRSAIMASCACAAASWHR